MNRAPPIHVVAAVLRDARGRILLARRGNGRDLAGLWEFPGGKVESGESATQALRRELHEELGIEIGADGVGHTPLIAVPQAYPDKRICLDVREVAAFSGRARGREGQALTWALPEKLASYAMPPADRPVVAALRQPDRYLITPEPGADDALFLAQLARAFELGVGRVQLRVRLADAARLAALARAARDLAQARAAELWLNAGHAAAAGIAAELGLGLHLTAAQLRARRAPPPGRLAASCHDADELRLAQDLGCDFAVLGPVSATPTHPAARPLGWEGFAALREQVALPIYALGGMRVQDLGLARAHGAQGVAAIRGLWPDAAQSPADRLAAD